MNRLRRSFELGVLTLAGSLLGCGGSGGAQGGGIMLAPETCGSVDPCGGDLTGTWKVVGGCITPAETEDADCLQETFQLLTLSYGGTVTFNPDMTYTAPNFTRDRAEIDTFPSVCQTGYMAETCADRDKAYKSQVTNDGTGLSSASCSGSTTCTCSLAETAEKVIGDSGTYSLQGNYITFNSDIGGFDGLSYCVQNGLFHLTAASTTVDSSGTETTAVYEDIVAQMQ